MRISSRVGFLRMHIAYRMALVGRPAYIAWGSHSHRSDLVIRGQGSGLGLGLGTGIGIHLVIGLRYELYIRLEPI